MFEEKFMRQAIALSLKNIDRQGGPFGAVVVKDGKVVATGCNRVTATNDPTAHAEVSVIRKACKKLRTFNLSGCEIYSSCEPCPMCLSAIYWAHIDTIYYGNTKAHAAQIGFDDSFIYRELALKPAQRKIVATQHLPDEAIRTFQAWTQKTDKIDY
ncbi:MAG: nucleoside deaminase [Prevotellaceae bacterium]|jgi:tRNA(Arg) A34 adenosine deaminase TadA|nr:nucleoside deaminase [Prevotellaceae bacterium]